MNAIEQIILDKMDSREWLEKEIAERCGLTRRGAKKALLAMYRKRLVARDEIVAMGTRLVAWRAT